MKIYTKGGDLGKTSLLGGSRVLKSDQRVVAYGSVDELVANISYLLDTLKIRKEIILDEEEEVLKRIVSELMYISALLCDPLGKMNIPVGVESVSFLEKHIDTMMNLLPKMDAFIMPYGDVIISLTHICRTVSRRSEREIVLLYSQEGVITNELVLMYLNRLSDYLFALSRYVALKLDIKEIKWNR